MNAPMDTELDRELEKAQAALLARFAPDTEVRRIRWSQGETQLFELGTGAPLLYVHVGSEGHTRSYRSSWRSQKTTACWPSIGRVTGWPIPSIIAAVDLLDHARTFLSDILDALELPTVALAANSLGALWSIAFAIKAPNRVSRLALVGAPAGLKQRPPLPLILLGLPLIGQRLGRHVFSNATRDGSRKFWGQVLVKHPERVDDLLLDVDVDVDVAHAKRNVESMLGLMNCIADARRLGLRRELILGERWEALTTPTLLVWGDGDAFGSLKEAESLVMKNPNLRLARIAGAGHLPWLDDPESVIAEIERFLTTQPRVAMPSMPSQLNKRRS